MGNKQSTRVGLFGNSTLFTARPPPRVCSVTLLLYGAYSSWSWSVLWGLEIRTVTEALWFYCPGVCIIEVSQGPDLCAGLSVHGWLSQSPPEGGVLVSSAMHLDTKAYSWWVPWSGSQQEQWVSQAAHRAQASFSPACYTTGHT